MENRVLHKSVGTALARLEHQSRNGGRKPFALLFSGRAFVRLEHQSRNGVENRVLHKSVGTA